MAERICSVEDCERPHYGKSWCQLHYNRMRNAGSLELAPKSPKFCRIDGCGAELKPPYGRGLCSLHYQRWRVHGDPEYVTPRPLRIGVEPCEVEGCEKVIQARGLCAAHWSRWKRHGSPTGRVRAEVVNGCRICPRCEVDVPLDEWGKGYCRACISAIAAERRAANPTPPKRDIPRLCAHCGEWFMGNKKNRRYCTPACRVADRRRQLREQNDIRRARERAVEYEEVDRATVYRRDNYQCGICGGAIDPQLAWPDPGCASLDHVIPVSRGGSHTYANVQASHLDCNVRKRDKVPTA